MLVENNILGTQYSVASTFFFLFCVGVKSAVRI